MKKGLFLILFLIAGAFAIPAEARVRRDADMFRDTTWSSYGRPSVKSDLRRGPDMFNPVPVMLNPNAELFDGFKTAPISLNAEMLHVRPRQLPYWSPIFTNDHWTN